eukprot:14037174-Alexandrium_andersonii.AAC.1
MSASLVGSEMCIRDSAYSRQRKRAATDVQGEVDGVFGGAREPREDDALALAEEVVGEGSPEVPDDAALHAVGPELGGQREAACQEVVGALSPP